MKKLCMMLLISTIVVGCRKDENEKPKLSAQKQMVVTTKSKTRTLYIPWVSSWYWNPLGATYEPESTSGVGTGSFNGTLVDANGKDMQDYSDYELEEEGLSRIHVQGTNMNIIVPVQYRTLYPQFCGILDNLYIYLTQNPQVLNAMVKYIKAQPDAPNYAELDEDEEVKAFIMSHISTMNYTVPIVNVETVPDKYGIETAGWWVSDQSDRINFSKSAISQFEAVPIFNNSVDGLRMFIVALVLHEFVHWGDNQDFMAYKKPPFEEGNAFEFDAFGADLNMPKKLKGAVYTWKQVP